MTDTASTSHNRLEQVVEAGLLLTSELSLEGVLQQVADLARELLSARDSAIGVLAEDGRTLSSFINSGVSSISSLCERSSMLRVIAINSFR